jgi:hypothetical protein
MTRYMFKRLARAAALRARGHDWIAVAKAVNSRPTVCRRWPEKYPKEWLMLYVTAQQMVFEAITREAVWTLGQMARSADPKERAGAEKLLRRYGHKLPG